MKPVKLSKCKICPTLFQKWSSTQKTCSVPCALELAKRDREKKERKEYLAQKVKLRTRREWLKLAQTAFNSFIRLRDANLPCISCGRFHQGQYHAGHFLSTGAHPELRFDENNCHKQCAPCNDHLSGNIALYRQALIVKVGPEELARLEGLNNPKKWTIPELQEILAVYKEKAKAAKK